MTDLPSCFSYSRLAWNTSNLGRSLRYIPNLGGPTMFFLLRYNVTAVAVVSQRRASSWISPGHRGIRSQHTARLRAGKHQPNERTARSPPQLREGHPAFLTTSPGEAAGTRRRPEELPDREELGGKWGRPDGPSPRATWEVAPPGVRVPSWERRG